MYLPCPWNLSFVKEPFSGDAMRGKVVGVSGDAMRGS